MTAKDIFHQIVKSSLEKDGWKITADPFYLSFAEIEFSIDLAAERLLAAEKDQEKIAIEIKSFIKPSAISEFHTVLGQFLNYRFTLESLEPDRILFLAIPKEIYNTFFTRRFVQLIIEKYQLNLIVFDPTNEEVVLWKK